MKKKRFFPKDEFGLDERDWNDLNTVFSRHPELQKVILFGSRAKGNFRPGSDIDLSIEGDDAEKRLAQKIHFELDEQTNIPYFFDVVNLKKISSPKLLEHIAQCGKIIFEHQNG